jgi:hypothetical protein
MTVVVNFWAGAGVGKSTQTARLFTLMKAVEKDQDFSVDLVREYAKELAWMQTPINDRMQNHIYFEQLRREMTLVGNVDYIITDSPTGIGIFYSHFYSGGGQGLLDWERHKRSTTKTLDFWCPRLKPYNPKGRYETEEKAAEVDVAMRRFLPEILGVTPIELSDPDFGSEAFGLLLRDHAASRL